MNSTFVELKNYSTFVEQIQFVANETIQNRRTFDATSVEIGKGIYERPHRAIR